MHVWIDWAKRMLIRSSLVHLTDRPTICWDILINRHDDAMRQHLRSSRAFLNWNDMSVLLLCVCGLPLKVSAKNVLFCYYRVAALFCSLVTAAYNWIRTCSTNIHVSVATTAQAHEQNDNEREQTNNNKNLSIGTENCLPARFVLELYIFCIDDINFIMLKRLCGHTALAIIIYINIFFFLSFYFCFCSFHFVLQVVCVFAQKSGQWWMRSRSYWKRSVAAATARTAYTLAQPAAAAMYVCVCVCVLQRTRYSLFSSSSTSSTVVVVVCGSLNGIFKSHEDTKLQITILHT